MSLTGFRTAWYRGPGDRTAALQSANPHQEFLSSTSACHPGHAPCCVGPLIGQLRGGVAGRGETDWQARGVPGNMAERPKKRPCGPVSGRSMGSGLVPGAAVSHGGVLSGLLLPPHPLPSPELAGLAAPIYIHSQGDGVLSPLLA